MATETIITDGHNPPICHECKAGWLEFVDDARDNRGASFWICQECKTQYELFPSQWTLKEREDN